MKRSTLFLGGLVLLVSPVFAWGHTFQAPTTVQANADGSFSYSVVLIPDYDFAFGATHIDGTDNTDIGSLIFDGFCAQMQPRGTVLSHTVSDH